VASRRRARARRGAAHRDRRDNPSSGRWRLPDDTRLARQPTARGREHRTRHQRRLWDAGGAAADFVGITPGGPANVYPPATPLQPHAPLHLDAESAALLAGLVRAGRRCLAAISPQPGVQPRKCPSCGRSTSTSASPSMRSTTALPRRRPHSRAVCLRRTPHWTASPRRILERRVRRGPNDRRHQIDRRRRSVLPGGTRAPREQPIARPSGILCLSLIYAVNRNLGRPWRRCRFRVHVIPVLLGAARPCSGLACSAVGGTAWGEGGDQGVA
jgi:hypothetical protein